MPPGESAGEKRGGKKKECLQSRKRNSDVRKVSEKREDLDLGASAELTSTFRGAEESIWEVRRSKHLIHSESNSLPVKEEKEFD